MQVHASTLLPARQAEGAGVEPVSVPGINSRDAEECTPLHVAILHGALVSWAGLPLPGLLMLHQLASKAPGKAVWA